ncbi:MAG: hypothetical protein ABIL70_07200 [candidate division WOR-3 bacterium]
MAILQTIFMLTLIAQGPLRTNELIDKGTVFAIEDTRVNIGGVWFEFLPEIKDISQIFEVKDIALIKPPFRAQITFVPKEDSPDFYVKKIKIIPEKIKTVESGESAER